MTALRMPPEEYAFLARDMRRVDAEIRRLLQDSPPPLNEAAGHLLKAGGKRLRPLLVVICSHCGSPSPQVFRAAAAVELIHTATLVHDDLVDGAATRRNLPTVNSIWNGRTTVLAGDYLFSHAFSVLSRLDNIVVREMCRVMEAMCIGEIDQLAHAFDTSQTEDDYLRRIGQKTAAFLAACCRLGGRLGGLEGRALELLYDYGWELGLAFQMVDDLLDFIGSSSTTGKTVGNDLRSGVLTLPVIYALSHPAAGPRLRPLLQGDPGPVGLQAIKRILADCGALDYAGQQARLCAGRARRHLGDLQASEPVSRALNDLMEFVLRRTW